MSSVQSSDSTISSKDTEESLDGFKFDLEEVTKEEALLPDTLPPLNEEGPKMSKQASAGEPSKKKVKDNDSSCLTCIIHIFIWYA